MQSEDRKEFEILEGQTDFQQVTHPTYGYSSWENPFTEVSATRFKDDVTQWTTFWDSYKSAVHDSKDISTIDKLNYLKFLLEGSTARCIQGLPITEHNYDNAVELLQEPFGKPQFMVAAHMDELIKIPVASDKPGPLRFIFDKVNVHTRG